MGTHSFRCSRCNKVKWGSNLLGGFLSTLVAVGVIVKYNLVWGTGELLINCLLQGRISLPFHKAALDPSFNRKTRCTHPRKSQWSYFSQGEWSLLDAGENCINGSDLTVRFLYSVPSGYNLEPSFGMTITLKDKNVSNSALLRSFHLFLSCPCCVWKEIIFLDIMFSLK